MIDSLLQDAQNGTQIEFQYLTELIPESNQEDYTLIFELGQFSGFVLDGSNIIANISIPLSDQTQTNKNFLLKTDLIMVDEHHDLSTTAIQKQDAFPRKKPIKDPSSEENFSSSGSEEDYSLALKQRQAHKKNKAMKRGQYPTKNFLPSFRTSFINYLAPHFQRSYFDNMEIIRRIRNKKCINLKDYQDLFNTEEFRPILEIYFNDRVIYRDLMSSRIETKTKAHYSGKVWVFEQAFRNRVFEKIN